ncbi:hypothetical protein BS101_17190 [Clostridium kluyveri]|uniref:Uncharacterized protein n=1 Tax=Clostridium kluyveri TaxID=1534 RepID=A0A1L5FBF9_CLOKL|nr:hypothetical protein BS101_17190 [Clostridium kluyveri]
MGGVIIKNKLLSVFLSVIVLSLSGNALVYAANGEVYDLTTQSMKYTLEDLTSLKIQMYVGLHSSNYGYEYDGHVYSLNDVNKVYVTERKSGNKNLSVIFGKVKSDCKPAFTPNSFFIKSIEYVDETFSSNLYVEVSDSEKVTGVTVDGVQLQLDDRYSIENDKIKITFEKGTAKDNLGEVLINSSSKSYKIELGSDGNFKAMDLTDFDVEDIY